MIRLMLAEYGVGAELVDISPWRREPDFLDINPAANVPVMLDEPFPPVVGVLAAIAPYRGQFRARRPDRDSDPGTTAASGPRCGA